jgi:hypothetical protein
MEFFFYVFTAVKIQVELGCDAVQCFGGSCCLYPEELDLKLKEFHKTWHECLAMHGHLNFHYHHHTLNDNVRHQTTEPLSESVASSLV